LATFLNFTYLSNKLLFHDVNKIGCITNIETNRLKT